MNTQVPVIPAETLFSLHVPNSVARAREDFLKWIRDLAPGKIAAGSKEEEEYFASGAISPELHELILQKISSIAQDEQYYRDLFAKVTGKCS